VLRFWCHLSKQLEWRGLAFSIALTIRLAADFEPRFLSCIPWWSGGRMGACRGLIACQEVAAFFI